MPPPSLCSGPRAPSFSPAPGKEHGQIQMMPRREAAGPCTRLYIQFANPAWMFLRRSTAVPGYSGSTCQENTDPDTFRTLMDPIHLAHFLRTTCRAFNVDMLASQVMSQTSDLRPSVRANLCRLVKLVLITKDGISRRQAEVDPAQWKVQLIMPKLRQAFPGSSNMHPRCASAGNEIAFHPATSLH